MFLNSALHGACKIQAKQFVLFIPFVKTDSYGIPEVNKYINMQGLEAKGK